MSTFIANLDSVTPPLTAQHKIVLWIGANAGGVGKTTLAVHIGYEMACRGFDTAILDLDSNGSMSLFCGLPRSSKPQNTMAAVFAENFNGAWPLITPSWGEPNGKLQICPGGGVMSKVVDDLSSRRRREYILSDRLSKYPLAHNLVILDCPATLGSLNDAALAAATHLLIPVQLTYKSIKGSDGLLEWYRAACRDLALEPAPKILGFVPNQFDSAEAAQRRILAQLPDKLAKIKINCYKQIRYSSEFNNASGKGLPLFLYRGSHDACSDFSVICDDLTNLIKGEDKRGI